MAEATATQEAPPVSQEEKQRLQRLWEAAMQSQGKRIDADMMQVIKIAVESGLAPSNPSEPGTGRERKYEFKNKSELNEYLSLFAKEAAKDDNNKGRSAAPGEMLRQKDTDRWFEEDWSNYGWGNNEIVDVGGRLSSEFGFDDIQIRNTLEILVATGKKPADLLPHISKQRLDEMKRALSAEGYVRDRDVKLQFFLELGIRQEWIMRFIMAKDFAGENENIFHDNLPDDIEELGWQMSYQSKEFRVNADFPILEMRIVKKKNEQTGEMEIDTKQSRYYVNQSNIVRWVRNQMCEYFDLSPDSAHNFYEAIKLKKRMVPISITDMFLNEGKYFKSEDGGLTYNELNRQLQIEAWVMSTLRSFDVEYQKIYSSEEELPKKITQLFYESDITKHAYGKNMWYHMLTMPWDFKEANPGEVMVSDNKMGAIINEMIMAYFNISDFDELQKILGKNSSFFTKAGIMAAVDELNKHQVQRIGTTDAYSLLTAKEKDALLKAFDDNGQITTPDNKKNFLSFVNLFITQTPGAKTTQIIRKAMLNAMKQKYGVWNPNKGKNGEYELLTKDGKGDDYSLIIADFAAISWWRFSGMGAKNDTVFAGYDALSKVMNAEFYRGKMVQKGMAHGNPYSIPMFKQMVVDFMRGTTVQSETQATDEKGRLAFKKGKDGKRIPIMRQKTPYEVMMELQQVSTARAQILTGLQEQYKKASQEEQKRIQKDIDFINLQYQNCADQLTFRANTMRDYAANHLERGFKLYDQIMKADEPDVFEKATVFDPIRGVTFDRGKFQSELQEKFFKPLRYLVQTYDELNFNMDVRAQVRKKGPTSKPDEMEYQTIKLGEALFGRELLDRKQYWKVENGKYVMENGKHAIDYNKVQEDKVLLWKQWALMKIAADLHAHRARHSTDPAYNFTYYLNAIEALKSIPGEIWGDEFNMKGLYKSKSFFDKKDIAWMRKISGTRSFNLYTLAIVESLFWPKDDKEGTGVSEALANFFRAIAPGARMY